MTRPFIVPGASGAADSALIRRGMRPPFLSPSVVLATDPAFEFTGVGAWRPGAATNPYVQQVDAMETGNGSGVPGDTSASAWPNALRVAYKIASDSSYDEAGTGSSARDLSSSFFPFNDIDPAWVAKRASDQVTPMHSFYGTQAGWFPDAGNTSYQAAVAAEAVSFCQRNGYDGLYIDNDHGDCVGLITLSALGEYPYNFAASAQYTHATYRAAVIALTVGIGVAMRNAGLYVWGNNADTFDAALGESGLDFNNGNSQMRYWGQIAAAAPNVSAWNGFGCEYWEQENDTLNPRPIGTSNSRQQWLNFALMPATAQSYGRDFHGIVRYDGGTSHRYARATLLLGADPTGGSTAWLWNESNSNNTITSADLVLPTGPAVNTRQITGTLHWRQFQRLLVVVNPTLASDTQTILGASRTVASLDALLLAI